MCECRDFHRRHVLLSERLETSRGHYSTERVSPALLTATTAEEITRGVFNLFVEIDDQ